MLFRHFAFPVFWALLILGLCGLPGDELPDSDLWDLLSFDKAAHAILFAVLVSSLIVAFSKQHPFYALRYHARSTAVIIGFVYGTLIEGLQLIIFSQRSGDLMDMMANGIGCLAGLIMFYTVYGKSPEMFSRR
ncbi:MAG: VanZ family protein [Flavobacteriales bacterium]|nr:VanZ family protein [Flavobacteriales bacterium]